MEQSYGGLTFSKHSSPASGQVSALQRPASVTASSVYRYPAVHGLRCSPGLFMLRRAISMSMLQFLL